MTDADLTPEQDAVRRLLAEARHDEPMPPEVVDRLEATLASLVADRGEEALPTRTTTPVVDLGARRRRIAGVGVLAAAAVVVAGVALGQVLPQRSGSDSSSAGAADSATSRELGDRAEEAAPSDSAGDGSAGLGAPQSKTVAPFASAPSVSTTDPALGTTLLGLRADATRRPPGTADSLDSCELPALGRGRRLLAEVDGQPGVVVFRRADGATQQVDLYVCGTSLPVGTVALPAP